MIKAASVDEVESIWTTLFAKVSTQLSLQLTWCSIPKDKQALEGKNVKDMLLNVGSGGGAAAAPTGGAAGGAAEAPPEEAKKEEKEEGKHSHPPHPFTLFLL